MVPGMYHCMGGPGCTAFYLLDWIDQWVTSMIAPDRIVASYRSDGRVTSPPSFPLSFCPPT